MVTEDFFQNKKIMIVAAHPDDELLGLGASMHKLINNLQVETHVVILGEGLTSRADKRDTENWKKELKIHQNNIKEAQKCIGYQTVNTYDFPDNRFDSVALLDLVKTVEKEKSEFQPEIIFTHHGGDLNIDHQKTFEAVMTACRPMKGELVRSIFTFETPSATEWSAPTQPSPFVPNVFIDVSEKDVEAKIDGMEKYQFEKRNYPHPRSPKSLRIRAQYRGLTVGCEFAEAFCLVRSVSG